MKNKSKEIKELTQRGLCILAGGKNNETRCFALYSSYDDSGREVLTKGHSLRTCISHEDLNGPKKSRIRASKTLVSEDLAVSMQAAQFLHNALLQACKKADEELMNIKVREF